MVVMQNLFIRLRNLIVHEPAVILAVGIGVANAALVKTPAGYAAAAGALALRFVVSPAFDAWAVKTKVPDRALIEAVAKAIEDQQVPATPPTA